MFRDESDAPGQYPLVEQSFHRSMAWLATVPSSHHPTWEYCSLPTVVELVLAVPDGLCPADKSDSPPKQPLWREEVIERTNIHQPFQRQYHVFSYRLARHRHRAVLLRWWSRFVSMEKCRVPVQWLISMFWCYIRKNGRWTNGRGGERGCSTYSLKARSVSNLYVSPISTRNT